MQTLALPALNCYKPIDEGRPLPIVAVELACKNALYDWGNEPLSFGMRIVLLATLIGMAAIAVRVQAQAADTPAADDRAKAAKPPRVYALVAAMGDQFSFVTEVSRTGTHLSPYRRQTDQIPHDLLNRFALHSLDQGIARVDPSGKRVYMELPALAMDGVAPADRESVLIGQIKHALEDVPQRSEWDRILVATPAYRALEANGLSGKLQGFGLFVETQCQADCGGFDRLSQLRAIDPEPLNGAAATTSENKPIKARTFLAPFSYIAVWVIDPKTLEVLDRQESLDNLKLAQPLNKPLDFSNGEGQKYIAMRIAEVIDFSIVEAVVNSEVSTRRGIVEHGPVKEVKPEK